MAFSLPATDVLPRHPIIVGDKLLNAGNGATQPHIYPANGEVTGELKLASAVEVDWAVAAARTAFPAWRALSGAKRRDLMWKMASLVEANAALFGTLATLENGYPTVGTGHAVADAAQKFRYFGGWADKIGGHVVHTWGGPAHDYVELEPYGVVGAIIPWNGPIFAATMVMAPALAAGNCVVVKAPDIAPYTVMKLGELFLEAGFPPGVVNVVTGGADVGDAIVRHRGIDKIQFVGSGATAKKLLSTAAETLKPCGLELGGKSAVIVFADAKLPAAAQRGLSGAVMVSGQGCCNGTRLLVERPIYDNYLEMLRTIAAKIPIGDPLDRSTVMGPLISEGSLNRICGMVETAIREGGRLVTGGKRLGGDHAEGYYLPITIVADVDINSSLAQNEVFGPVLAVTPFDTEEEAIALANATSFGLGGYIHTENLRRAHYVAGQLQTGHIHVNGAGEAMQPNVPFGGWKQSGYGRLGGEAGLREFLQTKNIWMNLAS
jgi:acyl-CoA reductase-like NAD-dependent aldehyde dehydrogenase